MKFTEISEKIWQADSGLSGPSVVINGGSHGNEKPGIIAVEEMLASQEDLIRGKLTLSLGNLKAIDANVRSIHPRDLNKCFADVEGLESYEVARTNQLKIAWNKPDFLLDLHATIKPSKPFLAVPGIEDEGKSKNLLGYLGIDTVVTGKGLYPANGAPIYADTYIHSIGGLGVTVEAGWMEELEITSLIENVKNFLRALGVLSGIPSIGSIQIAIWDAYWNVMAGENFKFAQDWGNFQTLEAGQIFAHSDSQPLTVPEKSIVLFPKPNNLIVPGQEACIIAKAK